MSGNVSNHVWVEDATKPLGGYWVREKGTADGTALVSRQPLVTEMFNTAVVDGGTLAVFTASPALTAANIAGIPVSVMPANAKRITFMADHAAVTADGVSNILGWLVTISCGGSAIAKLRLDDALNTSANSLMVWASGSAFTAPSDSSDVVFVPCGQSYELESLSNDITDVYFIPVGTAATADGVAAMTIAVGSDS